MRQHRLWYCTEALLGFVIWVVITQSGPIRNVYFNTMEKVLLLGPLTIVPLGLALVCVKENRFSFISHTTIKLLQPFGACAVIISLLLPPGGLSALCASLWLFVTIIIFMYGCISLKKLPDIWSPELSINFGMIYLVVASIWLIFARLEINALGFDGIIVFLTAVHFHYAGFAAPIIVGMVGKMVAPIPKVKKLFNIVIFGVVAGIPLVGAGLIFSKKLPYLELAAVFILASSLILTAFFTLRYCLFGVKSWIARLLLVVSAFSSIFAMIWSYLYVWGVFAATMQYPYAHFVNIPQMIQWHGVANAFGFSLCGLVAWNIHEHKR